MRLQTGTMLPTSNTDRCREVATRRRDQMAALNAVRAVKTKNSDVFECPTNTGWLPLPVCLVSQGR